MKLNIQVGPHLILMLVCIDLAMPSPLIDHYPGVHTYADFGFDGLSSDQASSIYDLPDFPRTPIKKRQTDEDGDEDEDEDEPLDVTMDIIEELHESPLVQDVKRPDFGQQQQQPSPQPQPEQQQPQKSSESTSIPADRYRFDVDSSDIL